ncbi:MAG: septation protein A [Gammaproteobacteria bacterium]|nr:septation protein A [Gammaproteobacteria bacterium]
MKFLIEFLPIILFFAAYKLYSLIPAPIIDTLNASLPFSLTPGNESDAIYFATLIAIVISGITVLIHYIKNRTFNKNQTITFVLFIIFGGATLLLRDPTFIKWKPTVINLVFALIFFGSTFIGDKNLAQRFLGGAINAPKSIWNKLNAAWIIFFVFIAAINLYIAYNFSEEIWVNFKLFGMIGLTIAFIIIQMIILSRYIIVKPED